MADARVATPTDSAPAGRPTNDDSGLVERLRAGEDAAFEELVRGHGGRMLAVALRFLPEPDARDAVQDALLSVTRAIHKFEGTARLSTWLHRIVVNAALMKIRTRTRRREDSIDELLPRYAENGRPELPASPWREDVPELLSRSETRQIVRAAIQQLPESYRAVLLLRDIEERDTRETADLLGITEANTKVRLHRARQALRGVLDPHFRKENP